MEHWLSFVDGQEVDEVESSFEDFRLLSGIGATTGTLTTDQIYTPIKETVLKLKLKKFVYQKLTKH